MNSKFKIYEDPYFPSNKILLGYNAKTFLDAGYVYVPYVPVGITPIFASGGDGEHQITLKRLKKAGIKTVFEFQKRKA